MSKDAFETFEHERKWANTHCRRYVEIDPDVADQLAIEMTALRAMEQRARECISGVIGATDVPTLARYILGER